MNRQTFLLQSAAAGTAMILYPFRSVAQSKPEVDPYKPEIVKEFVGAGHNNLNRVKEMLQEYPNLLYCRWDWGNGDFEEAIEGAGHVGNKEIAQYLIENGARPNVFVLTMLGETAIVKAILEKYPALINSKGPHGFTLLHHAARGGETSKELLDYLKSMGLSQMQIKLK